MPEYILYNYIKADRSLQHNQLFFFDRQNQLNKIKPNNESNRRIISLIRQIQLPVSRYSDTLENSMLIQLPTSKESNALKDYITTQRQQEEYGMSEQVYRLLSSILLKVVFFVRINIQFMITMNRFNLILSIELQYQYIFEKTRSMEFDEYEQRIKLYMNQYEKSDNKAERLWKKVKAEMDLYQMELEDNYGSEERLNWLQQAKEKLVKLRQQKNLVVNKVQVKDILRLGQDIDERIKSIHKNTHEAISVSTYIRVQLEKQIQELDGLFQENKDFGRRVKKAKKGLRVIIRRAMLNRCTRFMCVLVVLGVIATIVIYVLKDNGIF